MNPRRVLLPLLALLLLIAAGMAVFFARRLSRTNPSTWPPSPSEFGVAPPSPPTSNKPSWPTPFSVKLRDLPRKEGLPPDTLRILVVGDSVSQYLGLAMRYRQDEKQAFVAERGVGNCSIFESKPYLENGKQVMSSSCSMKWAEDAAELQPDMTLVVMGGGFFSEGACTKKFQAEYESRVFELARSMGPHAGQIVITRVPYPVKAWRHSNVPERVDCFNEMLVKIADKGHYPVVDLMSHVCPTRECNMESEGKPIRPDGLHFDGGGTEETARWVLGELWRIRKVSRVEER